MDKEILKIGQFEVSEILYFINAIGYSEATQAINTSFGKDWRMPTIGEFFTMVDSENGEKLLERIQHNSFWLNANFAHERGCVVKYDEDFIDADIAYPDILNPYKANVVIAIRYNRNADYISSSKRIDNDCIRTIRTLFKQHKTDSIDISRFTDKIYVPDYTIQDGDYDSNRVIGVYKDPETKKISILTMNGIKEHLIELPTTYILALTEFVENVFKHIDEENLSVTKLWIR